MDHWNVSLKELKGIFMMQPLFQDSVKAWSVLHIKPERHFNRCFIFFILTTCYYWLPNGVLSSSLVSMLPQSRDQFHCLTDMLSSQIHCYVL